MSDESRHDPQLFAELQAYVAARSQLEMDTEQAARFEQLITTDAAARRMYVQYMFDSSSLHWWAGCDHVPPRVLPESADSQIASRGAASKVDRKENSAAAERTPIAAPTQVDERHFFDWLTHSTGDRGTGFAGFSGFSLFSMLVCFALGAAVASIAFVYQASEGDVATAMPEGDGTAESGVRAKGKNSYAATLVNLANCRWDSTRSTADLRNGGELGPGQSLSLLEGVAEIECELARGSVGRFQLEGPSLMMLSSQGMPNLQYGKLAAQISCGLDRYSLDTPLGRVVVPYEASIGLISSTTGVELHVFDGEALFEPLWPMEAYAAGQLKVNAGVSLRIDAATSADQATVRGVADASMFASRVSMTTSRLETSEKFVSAIRAARPVAYWRFERDFDGQVENEMGNFLHCRIYGKGVRWHSYPGNRAVEFGSNPEFGCLMTDEILDGKIVQDYSVEAWVKPSHFHHGALFSLVDWRSGPTMARSGLLLELCGPVAGPVASSSSWAFHPGQIRFLHRNPPGDSGGKSCFSKSQYGLRKWQHFVGVKQGDELRLYADGELTATERDSTALADGLHVLIGQLYPHDPRRVVAARPFVGELDEIALYDRALQEVEIVEHFQLARPITDAPAAATKSY